MITPLPKRKGLFGLAILILASLSSASLFADPSSMTHFVHELDVTLAPFRADLVLETNLTSIAEIIDVGCDMKTDLFNRTRGTYGAPITDLPEPFLERMSSICQANEDAFNTYIDLFTGTAYGIEERFLGVLFGMIASGVSGLILGASHSASQTEEQLKANDRHFVQVLKAHEAMTEAESHRLDELAAIVKKNMRGTERKYSSMESSIKVLSGFLSQIQQFIPFSRALDDLIMHKRLSPGFLRNFVLDAKLLSIKKQLAKKNLELVSEHEVDLFQFPVSFATFADHTLRIVIHIPVSRPHSTFKVHRYVDAPIVVDGQLIQIQPSKTYLAVRSVPNQPDLSFEFENDELAHCFSLKDSYTCPQIHGAYFSEASSCVLSIFRSNKDAILQNCEMYSLPQAPQFWQLTEGDFLVFHPSAVKLTVTCDNKVKEALLFQGLKKISVPRFCYAQSAYFILFGTSTVAEENAVMQITPVTFSLNELTHGETDFSDIDNVLSPAKTAHLPSADIPPFYEHPSFLSKSTLVGVGFAIFAVFSSISVLCFIKRRFRKAEKVRVAIQMQTPPLPDRNKPSCPDNIYSQAV